MIPGWRAGEVAIGVALLLAAAELVQTTQGDPLNGEQFCELVQDVCVLMADHLSPDDPPRLLIAHVSP